MKTVTRFSLLRDRARITSPAPSLEMERRSPDRRETPRASTHSSRSGERLPLEFNRAILAWSLPVLLALSACPAFAQAPAAEELSGTYVGNLSGVQGYDGTVSVEISVATDGAVTGRLSITSASSDGRDAFEVGRFEVTGRIDGEEISLAGKGSLNGTSTTLAFSGFWKRAAPHADFAVWGTVRLPESGRDGVLIVWRF